MKLKVFAAVLALWTLAACGGDNENSVGEFSNDLLGNEIMVEAVRDPEIPGVVCHVTYFDRSVLDRLRIWDDRADFSQIGRSWRNSGKRQRQSGESGTEEAHRHILA